MSNVRILMTADFEKALKEHDKILRRTEKLLEVQEKQRRESEKMRAVAAKEREEKRRIADEQRKLNTEAEKFRRLLDRQRTPQERMNRELDRADDLRRRQIITEREYLSIKRALNVEMQKEVVASNRAMMGRRMGGMQTAMRGAIGQVTALASAWLSVNTAVQAVTKSIESQQAVDQRGAEIARQRARGQEETLKNLFNLPTDQRQFALEQISTIDFPNRAILEQALGEVFSGSANKLDLTLDVMKQTAELTRNTPEQFTELARSLIVIAREANVTAEQAVGGLLSTAGFGQITRSTKTAVALGPVLGQASAIAETIGQDIQQAMKDAGAIFAAGTLAGVDLKGESTTTAVITALQVMQAFFEELDPNIAKLEQSIDKLVQEDVKTAAEKQAITQAEQDLRAAELEFGLRNRPGAREAMMRTERGRLEYERLELDVEQRKTALQEAIDNSTLGKDDREKLQLMRDQLAELKALRERDLTGIGERFTAFAGSQYALELALEGRPGERRFQQFIEELFGLVGRTGERFAEAREEIEFSAQATRDFVAELKVATDLLAVNNAAMKAQQQQQEQEGKAEALAREQMTKLTTEAMEQARMPVTFLGTISDFLDDLDDRVKLEQYSPDVPTRARALNEMMLQRLEALEGLGEWGTGLTARQLNEDIQRLVNAIESNMTLTREWLKTTQEIGDDERIRGFMMLNEMRSQLESQYNAAAQGAVP